MTRHRVCGFRLAVRQKSCSRCAALHALEPVQYFLPISMRGETANLRYPTTNRNPVPENLHVVFAVENASTNRARGLITDKHDRRFRIGHESERVMQNTSASHHSRCTDDDARARSVVEFLRLLA